MPRPIHEPGKGSYWTVDLDAGVGTKRERKRAAGRRIGLAQKVREAAIEKPEMPPPVRRTVRRSSTRGVHDREPSTWRSEDVIAVSPPSYVSRPTEDPNIDPMLFNAAPPAPPPTPSAYPQALMATNHGTILEGGQLGPADWHHLPVAGGPPTWGTPPSSVASPVFDRPFQHPDLPQCSAYQEPPPQMQWSPQVYHHGAFAGSSETISTLSSHTPLSVSPVLGLSAGSLPPPTRPAALRSSRHTTGSPASPSSSS